MTLSAHDENQSISSKRMQTVAYFVAFVTLGIVNASTGPLMQDMATAIDVSLSEVSNAFALGSAGYMVGSYIGGYLYDRLQGNRVLFVYFMMMIGLTLLVASIPGLWVLSLLMFFMGVAQGGVDVGGNTLLLWVHGDMSGKYMNLLHFFFGVGAAISPLVIGQLLKLDAGVQWSFLFVALCVVPGALIMWFTPSPNIRTKNDTAELDVQTSNSKGIRRLIVVLIAAFFFLYVGAEGGFGRWIATYARAMGLGDATLAANLTSVFWGALTVGRLCSIPITARFRLRYVLIADLLGVLLSASVIVLFPQIGWITWVGTAGAGLCMASIFPTMMSLAEHHLRVTGVITGWFFVGGSLGGLILPWIIGLLFERIGPSISVHAILGGIVLNCIVFAVLLTMLGQKRLSQNEG